MIYLLRRPHQDVGRNGFRIHSAIVEAPDALAAQRLAEDMAGGRSHFADGYQAIELADAFAVPIQVALGGKPGFLIDGDAWLTPFAPKGS